MDEKLTAPEVRAAAEAINPRAFSDVMLRLACGDPWHEEGHSSHSSCPHCGSRAQDSPEGLRDKMMRERRRARAIARRALRAAARVRPPV